VRIVAWASRGAQYGRRRRERARFVGRFRRPAGELIAHLDRTETATADAGGLVSLGVSDHRTVEPDGADRVLEAVPRAPARRRGARQVQARASAFPRKRAISARLPERPMAPGCANGRMSATSVRCKGLATVAVASVLRTAALPTKGIPTPRLTGRPSGVPGGSLRLPAARDCAIMGSVRRLCYIAGVILSRERDLLFVYPVERV